MFHPSVAMRQSYRAVVDPGNFSVLAEKGACCSELHAPSSTRKVRIHNVPLLAMDAVACSAAFELGRILLVL
jgi:hypothetical protein